MPLDLDFSDDYAIYDDPEQVVYEQPRRGLAPILTPVPNAIRLVLSVRERYASGGAYQSGDVKWLLPANVLPQGFAAAPGGVVVDSEGARYTVLDHTWERLQKIWECNCRNLAIAFNLRDRVSIERPEISYDAAGAAVKTFPPYGGKVIYSGILARVQHTEESIVDERGIRGFSTRYDVIVDRQVEITTDDRVLWNGKIMDIIGHRNDGRIDDLPVVETVLKP